LSAAEIYSDSLFLSLSLSLSLSSDFDFVSAAPISSLRDAIRRGPDYCHIKCVSKLTAWRRREKLDQAITSFYLLMSL
jgi:hypothetical protein